MGSDEAWQGDEVIAGLCLLRKGPHANVTRHQVLVYGPGETRLVSKLTMNVLLILNDCQKQDAAKRHIYRVSVPHSFLPRYSVHTHAHTTAAINGLVDYLKQRTVWFSCKHGLAWRIVGADINHGQDTAGT